MPDLSTDPKMMREQQDRDTPEEMERDETRPHKARQDADEKSARERESAKVGETRYATEQQEKILAENREAGEPAGDHESRRAERRGDDAGLARSDRSLLRD